MNFIAIDPRTMSVEIVDAKDLTDVYERVGLNKNEVDHGCICRFEDGQTICIVVGEDGLFKGGEGRYFSIVPNLYEGGAVIYAADEQGETVSINHKPPVIFFRDAAEVERMIAAGDVIRPQRAIGGEVTWTWPEVRELGLTKRESELIIRGLK